MGVERTPSARAHNTGDNTGEKQGRKRRWTVFPPRWIQQEPGLKRGKPVQAGLLAGGPVCRHIIRPGQQQHGQPTTQPTGTVRPVKVLSGSLQGNSPERTETLFCRITATKPPRGFRDTLSCLHSTRPRRADRDWRSIWRSLVL